MMLFLNGTLGFIFAVQPFVHMATALILSETKACVKHGLEELVQIFRSGGLCKGYIFRFILKGLYDY